MVLQPGLMTRTTVDIEKTGAFVARSTLVDSDDERCRDRGYCPEPDVCADALVSETLCGTLFTVDDGVIPP